MVVTTPLQTFTYEHPWRLVVDGYLKRYPTHERLPVLRQSIILKEVWSYTPPGENQTKSWTETGQPITDSSTLPQVALCAPASVQRPQGYSPLPPVGYESHWVTTGDRSPLPGTWTRRIVRRCFVEAEAPQWLKKALNVSDALFTQVTVVDYGRQSMIIENRNETFSDRMTLYDWCEYRPHPTQPDCTMFEQFATLQLPRFPLSGTVENYVSRSYGKNTARGREIDALFVLDVIELGYKATAPVPIPIPVAHASGLNIPNLPVKSPEIMRSRKTTVSSLAKPISSSSAPVDAASEPICFAVNESSPNNTKAVLGPEKVVEKVSDQKQYPILTFLGGLGILIVLLPAMIARLIPGDAVSACSLGILAGAVWCIYCLYQFPNLHNFLFNTTNTLDSVSSPMNSTLQTTTGHKIGELLAKSDASPFTPLLSSSALPNVVDIVSHFTGMTTKQTSPIISNTVSSSSDEEEEAFADELIEEDDDDEEEEDLDSVADDDDEASDEFDDDPEMAPATQRFASVGARLSAGVRGGLSMASRFRRWRNRKSIPTDSIFLELLQKTAILSTMTLRVPTWMQRLFDGKYQVFLLVEVTYTVPLVFLNLHDEKEATLLHTNSAGDATFIRALQRTFDDFTFLAKEIQKSKLQATATQPSHLQISVAGLPKRKSNEFSTFIQWDCRRMVLERFLSAVIAEPGINQMQNARAHSSFAEFLTRPNYDASHFDTLRLAAMTMPNIQMPIALKVPTVASPLQSSLTMSPQRKANTLLRRNNPSPNPSANGNVTTGTLTAPTPPLSSEQRTSSVADSWLRFGILTKARWRTCWQDIWVGLDAEKVSFFCKGLKQAHCTVPVDDVARISLISTLSNPIMRGDSVTSCVTADENPPVAMSSLGHESDHSETPDIGPVCKQSPFSSHYFLQIQTVFGENHYLCSHREEVIRGWYDDLLVWCPKTRSESLPSMDLQRFHYQAVRQRHRIASLQNGKLVLNKRILYFHPAPNTVQPHPCELAKSLFLEVLNLFQSYADAKCVLTVPLMLKLQSFSLRCCALQRLPLLSRLSHSELLCFYLNIYHTLTIHATLDVGRPATLARRRLFTSSCCYELDGFLYSLADLEHAVLRAPLTRPMLLNNAFNHVLVSGRRFQQKDPRLMHAPLLRGDSRVNFVLNSGTQSSIYHVYLFDVDRLDRQLDHAVMHYLNEQVSFDEAHRTVLLPRVCQWFGRDFGVTRADILNALFLFMPKAMQRDIIAMCALGDLVTHQTGAHGSSSVRSVSSHAPRKGTVPVTALMDDAESLSDGDLLQQPSSQTLLRGRPSVSAGDAIGTATNSTELPGKHLKIKYADYDWASRGVFFRGHDIDSDEPCPLR